MNLRTIDEWPEHLPTTCSECGAEASREWVKGWYGWVCGTYSIHGVLEKSIPCAAAHWRRRAERAEATLNSSTEVTESSFVMLPGDSIRVTAEPCVGAYARMLVTIESAHP